MNQLKIKTLLKIAITLSLFLVPTLSLEVSAQSTQNTFPISIIILNGNSTVSQATVTVDDQSVTTESSGEADFNLASGSHSIQVFKSNQLLFNSTMVTVQDQTFRLDISPYLPTSTTSTSDLQNTDQTSTTQSLNIYASASILIIAMTGIIIVILLIKR